MDVSSVVDLTRNALFTAILLASPALLVGLIVGLTTGIIQAVTQIQDHSLSFVPKLVAMAVALAVCLPWFLQRLLEYSTGVIREIPAHNGPRVLARFITLRLERLPDALMDTRITAPS